MVTRRPNAGARLAAFAAAWFLALLGIGATAIMGGFNGLVDANAYWLTGHGPMYSADYQLWTRGYSYPPPFALLLTPLTQLSWDAFRILWLGAVLVAYTWLLWGVRPGLRLPLVLALMIWASDNLYWALAVVAVIGFRYPAAWALPLLTKITPGVGVAWFAARFEWRSLAIALGTTAAIAAVSYILAPDAWATWIALMRGQDLANTSVTNFFIVLPSLPIRVALALVLVVVGARTDRRWTVPVAMLVAQPDISFAAFGLLAAIPRLRAARTAGDWSGRWSMTSSSATRP
jgi:hypothetical protein